MLSLFLLISKNLTVLICPSREIFSSFNFWYFRATSLSSFNCSSLVSTSLRIREDFSTLLSTVLSSFVACSILLSNPESMQEHIQTGAVRACGKSSKCQRRGFLYFGRFG